MCDMCMVQILFNNMNYVVASQPRVCILCFITHFRCNEVKQKYSNLIVTISPSHWCKQ